MKVSRTLDLQGFVPAWEDVSMAKHYPQEFPEDFIAVVNRREPG